MAAFAPVIDKRWLPQPLPCALKSNEPGTWAHNTMTQRVPHDIMQRIFDDNVVVLQAETLESKTMLASLKKLYEDISSNSLLSEIVDGGPDQEFWNRYLRSHLHATDCDAGMPSLRLDWLNTDWMFAEFYFYRRVIQSFNYFVSDIDPFRRQKEAGLVEALPIVADCLTHVFELLPLLLLHQDAVVGVKGGGNMEMATAESSQADLLLLRRDLLRFGIYTSLWGNKMDLSLWPAATTTTTSTVSTTAEGDGKRQNNGANISIPDNRQNNGANISIPDNRFAGPDRNPYIRLREVLEVNKSHLIDDYSDRAIEQLLLRQQQQQFPRPLSTDTYTNTDVAIIVDNAGYEIVSDLILGYLVLQCVCNTTVVYHTKAYPTFVSDATTADVMNTLQTLSAHSHPVVSQFGEQMLSYVATGRVRVEADVCWCQPIALYDLNLEVQRKFQYSSMVFIKGDANYRRLVGDLHWPFDTALDIVIGYWKIPVCALRTLKSEVCINVPLSRQEELRGRDVNWCTSGQWGVVHTNQWSL